MVNELQDVFADRQLMASRLLQQMPDQRLGPTQFLRPAFFTDDASSATPQRAPRLGDHSAEILAEIGLTDAEVAAAVESRVVADLAT